MEDLHHSRARRARRRNLDRRHWKRAALRLDHRAATTPISLAYWGTGNAAPWMGDMRPGDNLYSTSVIALDATPASCAAHHQYHWNESWDWDEVSAPLLIDFPRRDAPSALVHPAATAICGCSSAARRSGSSTPSRTSTGRLHAGRPETGRPELRPSKKPAAGKKITFCPRSGAARTGRRRRTTRRPATSIFRRRRTCAGR